MQYNYQKRNWPQWLIPTLGSTFLTILVMSTAFWFQNVWATMPSVTDEPAATTTFGTVPYQAHLTDATGASLTGNYTMKFNFYNQAAGGSPIWTEDRSGANQVQITDGYFSIMLGSVTPINQNIAATNSTLYLGITIGTDSELAPRVELGSVLSAFVTTSGEQGVVAPSSRQAIKQVDVNEPTTYEVSTTRYHIEATKAQVNNTVPLDMELFNELCRDVDGCTVRLGMRDWDNNKLGSATSRNPYSLFYSQKSTHWRISTDIQGMDGNGSVQHILHVWGCYFTDGEFVDAKGSDNLVQLGLLNWNTSGYTDPDMVCMLTIDD